METTGGGRKGKRTLPDELDGSGEVGQRHLRTADAEREHISAVERARLSLEIRRRAVGAGALLDCDYQPSRRYRLWLDDERGDVDNVGELDCDLPRPARPRPQAADEWGDED